MTHSLTLKAALCSVGIGLAVPSSVMANPAQSIRIGYSDLDLVEKNDLRVLDHRIARAIEMICGSYAEVHEMIEMEKIDKCRSAARQKVEPQIANLLNRRGIRLSSATGAPERK